MDRQDTMLEIYKTKNFHQNTHRKESYETRSSYQNFQPTVIRHADGKEELGMLVSGN